MDNIKTVLINHVHSCNNPKDECEKIMIYAVTLRQTIVDNNKPVSPPHGVYPSFPKNADKKINEDIDRQAKELGLKITHVELKGPGVKTSRD